MSCTAKIAARAAPAVLLTAAAFFGGARFFYSFFSFSCSLFSLLLSSLSLLILNISSQLCCGIWCSGGLVRRGSSDKPLRYSLPPLSLVTDYRHCAETQGCSLPGCISTTFVYIVCFTTNDSPGYCRLRQQPYGLYFMYIYQLISIVLQSSCSDNSTTLQKLTVMSPACLPYCI